MVASDAAGVPTGSGSEARPQLLVSRREDQRPNRSVSTRQTLPVAATRFPALRTGFLSRRRIYLDNACLTPTPAEVVDAVRRYYTAPPGCPGRSTAERSVELETAVHAARDSVRRYLRAAPGDDIVFTPNTTYGINVLSSAFARIPGKVLISDLEHNSNRLPWLEHERVELAWPPGAAFPLDEFRQALRAGVKLVSLTARSNVTGMAPPLQAIMEEADALGIPVHLDAAQAFPSGSVDVSGSGPAFATFSFHKAYGPSGLGGLYIRRGWMPRLAPALCGAGAVDDHHDETSQWSAGAARMEFGLQNYAAIVAVPATMALLSGLSPTAQADHFRRLTDALREVLASVPGLRIIGPADASELHTLVSFHVQGVPAGKLASLLDQVGGIQVRTGRLCAHHWFHRYRLPDVLRVSFGIHNSLDEVDSYGRAMHAILRHFV